MPALKEASLRSTPMVSLTPARQRIVLATCCLSLFVIFMDVTIVNVALPAIRADFHTTTAALQWTIDGYTIIVASLLLLAGSMADRFGRRRVFQCGMALFSLGSALCGLAPTASLLVLFRAVQALGGSMLNPVALAIITNTFLAPTDRARAVGVWGAVAGVAMAMGPVAGGLLTQFVGWRANFWVNLPIGAIAIVCAQLFIPESKAAKSRPIDFAGQILVVLFLSTFMASIIEGPTFGWWSASEFLFAGISASAFVALVITETYSKFPLIDLLLFRVVPFAGATVVALCSFFGFGALLFSASLILHESYAFSAAQSGFCILPIAAGTVFFAPISARMVGRWGARPSLIISGFFIAASGALLLTMGAAPPLGYFVFACAIFGIGFGMVNAPITYTAISGLPRDRAGVAAAFASASRQTGIALGVALAGAIGGRGADFVHRTQLKFLDRITPLWWIILSIGAFIALLGYIATSFWAIATARHVAHLFADEMKEETGG